MVQIIKAKNLEERVFSSIKSGKEKGIETPLIVYSGSLATQKEVDEFRGYFDKLDKNAKTYLSEHNLNSMSQEELALGIYRSLNEEKSHRFQSKQYDLNKALESQVTPDYFWGMASEIIPVGNCESLTMMYTVLGWERNGLNLKVVEDDSHHANKLILPHESFYIDHTAKPGFRHTPSEYKGYNERNPEFLIPLLLFEKGKDLIGKNDKAAINYLNKSIELEPELGKSYINRAIARLNTERTIDNRLARKDLEIAQKLGHSSSDFFYYKGLSEKRRGKNKVAFFDLTRAITKNPELDKAYFERGQVLYGLNEFDHALRDFTKFIDKNDFSFMEGYYWRAKTKIKLKDYEGAREDINQVLKDNPYKKRALMAKGIIEIKSGNTNQAKRDFFKAAPKITFSKTKKKEIPAMNIAKEIFSDEDTDFDYIYDQFDN